eukprot:GFUD01093220.1.p1 GENE.GFUD01093220.1~~GFUD01093220.1.p1  ORF type:complete len:457 (-),score=135.10 GFUD01093220.1:337-1707(-)
MCDQNCVKKLHSGTAAIRELFHSEATEETDTTELSEQNIHYTKEMESELKTDSLQGSPVDNLAEIEDSSPDSVARLLDALINDDNGAEGEEVYIPEDLSNAMAETALYVGSFFDSSTWNATSVDNNLEVEAKANDMESALKNDQLLQGSPVDDSAEMENSIPIEIGSDSVAGLLDTLINDDNIAANEEGAIPEDLSNTMAEAALYVGSFFDSSTWNATSVDNNPKVEAEAKTTMDGKQKEVNYMEENTEESPVEETFFYSAFSKIGISCLTQTLTIENIDGKPAGPAAKTETEVNKEGDNDKEEAWEIPFSNAFTKFGKVATDYTKIVQDSVYSAPLLVELNQEQEEYIKNSAKNEMPNAPWTGFHNEEVLKDKILALSGDKRNFLRAQPTGVNFDFEYSAIASHAEVLLDADPRLQKMRYELVPKKVNEDTFWSNYFYQVGLVKQSCEVSSSSWW